jgi:hypothetical protein
LLIPKELSSFDNFSGFNAPGADFHTAIAAARKLNANRLQIRVEPATGFVVCVGYVISELRPFAADVTSFCHNKMPPKKLRG